MRPVLVIGEILADPEGPKGMGVEIACALAEGGTDPVMFASRLGDGEIGRGLVNDRFGDNSSTVIAVN